MLPIKVIHVLEASKHYFFKILCKQSEFIERGNVIGSTISFFFHSLEMLTRYFEQTVTKGIIFQIKILIFCSYLSYLILRLLELISFHLNGFYFSSTLSKFTWCKSFIYVLFFWTYAIVYQLLTFFIYFNFRMYHLPEWKCPFGNDRITANVELILSSVCQKNNCQIVINEHCWSLKTYIR